MANPYFQFKQFTIWHDKTAMKVGTDGVLLGAWATVENNDSVLDIGAGTGLIALMMAQRGASAVDAVEIDEDAFLQTCDNISHSQWNTVVTPVHVDIKDFSSGKQYHRIVSNPPFFNNALLSPEQKRTVARHSVGLSWNILIQKAFELLLPEGSFSVVLPWPDAKQFVSLALISGFYESRVCLIASREGKEPNRVLLEFTKQKNKAKQAVLCLRNSDNSYTDEYKLLTHDFYLKF